MSGNYNNSNQYNQHMPIFNKDMYNVNTSHPLITNSQEYLYIQKFISIHSEDRDYLKYPNASEFEIELPEDYLNVVSLKLIQWTFPANYNTFSLLNGNVFLAFRFDNLYNPGEFGVSDDYNFRIFEALFNSNRNYVFQIEEGFYNPGQIVTELTNKFNSVVTDRIVEYFEKQMVLYPADGWDDTLNEFTLNGGYNRFVVVYNNVSQKVWFGNRADGFTILNEASELSSIFTENICLGSSKYAAPDFSNYGLPANLGLSRCNQSSISSFDVQQLSNSTKVNGQQVPRFYYGDVTPGDNGYWLLPLDLSGCQVHWIESLYKLNVMGEAYIYMEIGGQNCIDETKPYNVSRFTTETNQTNGVVNSSFAKIAVPTTPLSQWFDRDSVPYKYYYPPAERIRRLKIRIRYHNEQLVNFGVFNYSFMLEFTLMVPQILRNTYTGVVAPPKGR
jgi:hypothetical protein